MWFGFGFLTLAISIGYRIFSHYRKPIPNRLLSSNGVSYGKKDNKYNGSVVGYKIAIDAPDGVSFKLKRENWFDRLCKKLKISTEAQIQDAKFDDLVYISSDDEKLISLLRSDQNIKNAVLALFQLGGDKQKAVRSIQCMNGSLILTCRNTGKKDVSNSILELNNINLALEKAGSNMASAWKDPFVFKAIALLVISSGLGINAFVQLVVKNYNPIPFTINPIEFVSIAIVTGVTITVMLVGLAVFLLGRSSRLHLVLLELIVVGLSGALISSYIAISDFNQDFDQSGTKVFNVEVLDQYTTKRKNSTTYHLTLEDWTGLKYRRSVTVSSNLYEKFAIGDTARVEQRDGYFNVPWVDSVRYYR